MPKEITLVLTVAEFSIVNAAVTIMAAELSQNNPLQKETEAMVEKLGKVMAKELTKSTKTSSDIHSK